MQSFPSLLYSLYRITLVDEYEFSEMMQRDDIMAPLLCGSFLAASSILCANAVMQQASVILQVEDSMPILRRFYDNQFISTRCAPLADAPDDATATSPRYHDEMTRITTQIKVQRRQRFWNQELQNPKQVTNLQNQNPNQDVQNQDLSQDLQNQNLRQELHGIRAELQQLHSLVQLLLLVHNRTDSRSAAPLSGPAGFTTGLTPDQQLRSLVQLLVHNRTDSRSAAPLSGPAA
ncbi:Structural maintenance of chromosomes protein 3 like, partial [Dissostichus eleginoides]